MLPRGGGGEGDCFVASLWRGLGDHYGYVKICSLADLTKIFMVLYIFAALPKASLQEADAVWRFL